MKTLAMFLAETGAHAERLPSRDFVPCVQVFSDDPRLWALCNFKVSSKVSGPSVILIGAKCGFNAVRFANETWGIGRDYTGHYLNREGQWGSCSEGKVFNSQLDAEKFTCAAFDALESSVECNHAYALEVNS